MQSRTIACFAVGALWLRIDSIEQAIREFNVVQGALNDAGYRVAHAIAADNLCLGRVVIADCVNPWDLTRDDWRNVGVSAGAPVVEFEIICSDASEHRARVESRADGMDWAQAQARDYRPWGRAPVRIDTAGRTISDCLQAMLSALDTAALAP